MYAIYIYNYFFFSTELQVLRTLQAIKLFGIEPSTPFRLQSSRLVISALRIFFFFISKTHCFQLLFKKIILYF